VPNKLGMAGFNDISLLKGFSSRLATMDSGRGEIGRKAAEIIAQRVEAGDEGMTEGKGQRVELTPTINHGDTLRKRPAEAVYPE